MNRVTAVGAPERFPFGLLTMVVSLEAIVLSFLVMMSANRADEKREAIAALDHAALERILELLEPPHTDWQSLAEHGV